MVFTCRWGILATGGIANTFSKDLLLDPSSREVSDVQHSIVAVASSTSEQRAKEFITEVGADKQKDGTVPKAYGNYADFVKDKNIDVVYVATPHSHHYENVMSCLEAGLNVCCEKPFTVNEAQAQHLVKVAKQKNLFMMEAVWTRFFPIMIEIKKLLHEERVLGKILRSHSDLSIAMPSDPKHRLNNPDLAGGALLDLGIYPLTWQMALIYEDPDNKMTEPEVTSSMMMMPTGCDADTTVVLNWKQLGIQTMSTCSTKVRTSKAYCVLVQGEKGDLTIEWAPYRPESYTLHLKDDKGEFLEPKTTEHHIPGKGMFWEADHCARAIRDGKKEVDLHPLSTTLLTEKIMDKVRKDNNFRYPEKLEAVRSDA